MLESARVAIAGALANVGSGPSVTFYVYSGHFINFTGPATGRWFALP